MICEGQSHWDFSADKLWPWKEAEYFPLCWLLTTPEYVKLLFVPGLSAALRGGCLEPLSEFWCLHGLWGQHTPTASCRVGLHPGRPCTCKVSCLLLGPFCLQQSDGEDFSMEGPRFLTGQSWDIPAVLYHPEQNCSGYAASGAHLAFKFACKTHSLALAQFWFYV